MKKIMTLILFSAGLLLSACQPYDDAPIRGKIDDIDGRVRTLEEKVGQLNTNISSMKTILDALQSNDYVTSVTPLLVGGKEVGYTITFTKSKPVTIYHGTDGASGKDGTNGKDGSTPQIGVKADTDGIYYWTVNGEWMLDAFGKKVPATGPKGDPGENGENGQNGKDAVTPKLKTDGGYWYISYDGGVSWTKLDKAQGAPGENGQNGKDGVTPQLKIAEGYWYISYDAGVSWTKLDKAQGAPGENGQNGKDGVTPQLKIAEGYWYVSYDDGQTWIELYKAQGESGAPGKDGEDGKDGDSFFKNVVIGDYDVTFTLADGSEFTLPLGKPAFEFADSDPQAITTERNQVCILINEISEEASFIAGIEACDAVISTKAGRKWDAKLSFSENKDTLIVDVTPDGENPRAILTITRLLPGSSHSISKILENHDPISLATSEPANCYIVPHSGYYRFPAVYGNDIANTVTDINQVDVLWESYGTDIAPQAGDLVSDAIYEKGYISFFSSDKKGNAVIAARDKSGTILWSWHIWMTDEPEDQKYQGGVTMMDRNLGAVSAKPNDVGSFGLFYQWGRKDPFLGSSSTIGIIKEEDRIFPRALSCPNDIWEDTESDEYHGTVSFAVENPTCFIRYNDDNYDWYYTGDESTDKTRWAEWTKTVFDPCPPGYVVPPGGNYGVWSYPLYWTGQFDVGNIETVFDYSLLGLDFAYDGSRPYLTYSADVCWYPFTGYISESDAEIREVGQSSYLWSSTMYYSGDEQYFPYTFTISPWSIQLASVDDLAYGQTVRCVKFVNGLS